MNPQNYLAGMSAANTIIPRPEVFPLNSAAGRHAVAEVDRAALVTAAIGGVGLAGGGYAVLVAGVMILFSGVPFGMFGWIIPTIFAALIGMILSLFLAAIFALLIHGVSKSMDLSVNQPMFGALIGGITGYFAWTGWINGEPIGDLGFFLFGPCLATVLGQIGGAAGGAGYLEPAKNIRLEPEMLYPEHSNSHFQFDLRQLLVATAWCCALTTILKLIGCTPSGFLFVGIGIAAQVPVYLAGKLLWRRMRTAAGKRQVQFPRAVVD